MTYYRTFTEEDVHNFLRDDSIPILCRTEKHRKEFIKYIEENYEARMSRGTTETGEVCFYSDGCYSNLNYAEKTYRHKILEFRGIKSNRETLKKMRGVSH